MIDQTEKIQEKRSYLGRLKVRKTKNKVRNECFSEILSLVEEEYIITSGFGIVIENYCKKQISYNTKENENIEEEMGSVFNS